MSESSRIRPPAQLDSRQREVAEGLARGRRGGAIGPFGPLLHHPELCSRVSALGELVRFDGVLPRPVFESVVLSVAAAHRQGFEWAVHSEAARGVGVPEEVVAAIGLGADVDGPEELALAVRAARELLAGGGLDPLVSTAVESRWGIDGLLELVTVVGYYRVLADILTVAQVPAPEGHSLPWA